MCKKYKLQAKRPWQAYFTDWSATDDYEVIKRHIKVIESYGYEWRLTEGAEDEQREGEWLEINDGVLIGDGKHLECSVCGVWKKDKQRSNFCSSCGAKMKGGK